MHFLFPAYEVGRKCTFCRKDLPILTPWIKILLEEKTTLSCYKNVHHSFILEYKGSLPWSQELTYTCIGKREGKRTLERHRHRWKGSSNVKWRAFEGVNRIHLAQGKDWWRALVGTFGKISWLAERLSASQEILCLLRGVSCLCGLSRVAAARETLMFDCLSIVLWGRRAVGGRNIPLALYADEGLEGARGRKQWDVTWGPKVPDLVYGVSLCWHCTWQYTL